MYSVRARLTTERNDGEKFGYKTVTKLAMVTKARVPVRSRNRHHFYNFCEGRGVLVASSWTRLRQRACYPDRPRSHGPSFLERNERMKLPRLSDPVTTTKKNYNVLNETVDIVEVVSASPFDLLPTWAQYFLCILVVVPLVFLLALILVKP